MGLLGVFPACPSMPIALHSQAQTLGFSRHAFHVQTLPFAWPAHPLQIQGPALFGQPGCLLWGKPVNLSKKLLQCQNGKINISPINHTAWLWEVPDYENNLKFQSATKM